MMTWLVILVLWCCGYSALVIFRYREYLTGHWREPVFRHPILIIESDDWGPADSADVQAIERLRRLLGKFKDRHGRHPVLTIGVVLAVADTHRLHTEGLGAYHRCSLREPAFDALRQALRQGAEVGLFALQLHGLEHYRPASLLAAARTDDGIRRWLTQDDLPRHEVLPAHLQSRWTDASVLPSRALDADEIRTAVADEVSAFSDTFGMSPRVVVPPTFQWTAAVEQAWAAHGLETIITPGRRYAARAADGQLVADRGLLCTGQRCAAGPLYLVRNGYFEPAYGHTAETGLLTLAANGQTARATLLESHRFNYVGEGAEQAFAELERLLAEALSRWPALRFLSSAELAEAICQGDETLLEKHGRCRLRPWLRRLGQVPGLRKHAWLSGMMLLAGLLYVLGRERTAPPEDAHG